MVLTSYSVIPGVAELQTDADSISAFYYSQDLTTESLFDGLPREEISLQYEIQQPLRTPETSGSRYHFFQTSADSDVMVYRRPYLGSRTMEMVLQWGESPTIRVNEDYARLARFRINNIFPPGTILADVLSIRLLQNGYTPLYSACVAHSGEATLIFAPPNTGKTVTSVLAARNCEFQFLAEDITVTDGRTAYACPWTSTFDYDPALESTLTTRVRHILSERALILKQFLGRSRSPITDYLPSEKITARAPISNVVLLERGERSVEQLSRCDAVGKLVNLNRYQLHHWHDPALLAREYFADGFDLQQYRSTEAETIERIVDRTETYRISTDDPTTFVDSLVDVVAT